MTVEHLDHRFAPSLHLPAGFEYPAAGLRYLLFEERETDGKNPVVFHWISPIALKVAFSWVERPAKATRDAGMKKMMVDPRMDPSTPGNPPVPFDGKRMIFGGFEPLVEVKA